MKNPLSSVRFYERQVLAYMLQFPKEAFRIIDGIGVCREDFENETYASAFSAMRLCDPDDGPKIRDALLKVMGEELKDIDSQDEFLDTVLDSKYTHETICKFKKDSVTRQYARKLQELAVANIYTAEERAEQFRRLSEELSDCIIEVDHFGSAIEETSNVFQDTVPTPEGLMNVPGFVNAFAEHTVKTAPRPNRVLAFAGALAMLSLLVARKFTDKRNTMTNLYMVALADSGVGKDHPRKMNKALANRVDEIDSVAEQIGSGEGLEDALYQKPALLFQMDEFDTVLNMMKESNAITERMYTYLLNFFSESATTHALRRKAMSQEAKEAMANNPTEAAKKPSLKVCNPSLTLFATAIPSRFYSALSMRALENGLLARCLIFESGLRGEMGLGPYDAPLPDEVVNFATDMANRNQMMQLFAPVTFTMVPDAEDAEAAIKAIIKESEALYKKAEKEHDTAGKAVWNRGYEITCKLALLYALSENPSYPKITATGFNWAWKLVKYSSQRMLAMTAAYVSTDRDDDDCNKIIRYLTEHTGHRAPRGEIGHKLHISKKRLDAAEDTLVDRGLIRVDHGARGASIYRLINKGKRG